jgi:hypothetical protein
LIRWLKQWVWYFLSAFSKPVSVRITSYGQLIDEEHRINKITLSDRTQEKREFMAEWIKPENIAKRKEESDKQAIAFLEAYGAKKEEPLPPLETLPVWMRNQSPSTIRRMLKNGFKPESENMTINFSANYDYFLLQRTLCTNKTNEE